MSAVQILVVDDFLPWHRFVQAMLETEKDFNISAVATNGLEAVRKAEELQPDVILLDINLPALNGIEAARRIRKLSANSKILFVSQESSAEVVEEAFRLGAQGYLLKSDAARELLLAVNAVLQGKQFASSRLRSYMISNNADKQPAEHFSSEDLPLSPQREKTSRVHEVGSYRNDASLVDGLTRFVETALKKGDAVVVIATESHRSSILRRLQANGWNIAAAIQEGSYTSLDASDTLATFMVNDWPDATRLLKVAGNLIADAAKTAKGESPRVALCGECAPILWAQGKAEAAVQLERLWDTVARVHNVDILCGYSLTGLQRSENSQIFARICAEHSDVYSV